MNEDFNYTIEKTNRKDEFYIKLSYSKNINNQPKINVSFEITDQMSVDKTMVVLTNSLDLKLSNYILLTSDEKK